MKTIVTSIRTRLKEEATLIQRLESDVKVYRNAFKYELVDNIGKCGKCKKLVLLDHLTADDEECIVKCIECKPKKCPICDVYHVEEGVQELKEKEARKRKKKRRIVLG